MGMVGVLMPPLKTEFGWDIGAVSAALALRVLLYGMVAEFFAAGVACVVACVVASVAALIIRRRTPDRSPPSSPSLLAGRLLRPFESWFQAFSTTRKRSATSERKLDVKL